MPIWSEILNEIVETRDDDGNFDFDGVRRGYLYDLSRHTGRDVILYASGWLQHDGHTNAYAISDQDIQGLMEVTHGLKSKRLDLILHSLGGSAEAAEAIVCYLRSRFDHIRVIVPTFAKSAATMIACSADEIMLGKHSFLGPTDPQILIQTHLGQRLAPAQSILDQFKRAQKESDYLAKSASWTPMLPQYGPDLLAVCESALKLSKKLVEEWLKEYMFKNEQPSVQKKKAKKAALWLARHKNFYSHGRHIGRDEASDYLTITSLEENAVLQDLALSVFHATTHTFNSTPLAKIIENHNGSSFMWRISR